MNRKYQIRVTDRKGRRIHVEEKPTLKEALARVQNIKSKMKLPINVIVTLTCVDIDEGVK